MTHLLSRWFVRDYKNTSDPRVRASYGLMSSIVGILVNLLLFAGKLTIGLVFASVSITADAFNNLSDAGSSLISLVTFRIASKPADRDHPYGHARIEYASSLIVACIILVIGFQLARDSIASIFSDEIKKQLEIIGIVVLSISILGKLWLFIFYRTIGKKINSGVLTATATDSLSDTISTTAVLICAIIIRIFPNLAILDGIVGACVALFIMFAGIKILRENINFIMGEAPIDEVITSIKSVVSQYPDARGIHDMLVHNYGPGHIIASLHIEVDGSKDIFELHDVIDNIERHIREELHIECTIHMDPIVCDDPIVDDLKRKTIEAARMIDERLNIHDFRYVLGTTHHNLIFDVAVPFEIKMTDKEVTEAISEKIKEYNDTYFCVITIDRV